MSDSAQKEEALADIRKLMEDAEALVEKYGESVGSIVLIGYKYSEGIQGESSFAGRPSLLKNMLWNEISREPVLYAIVDTALTAASFSKEKLVPLNHSDTDLL